MAVTFLTNEDETRFVKSVNGVTPDENGNVDTSETGLTAEQVAQIEANSIQVQSNTMGIVTLRKDVAARVKNSGWSANKLLGTDGSGNVVETDVPEGGGMTNEQIVSAMEEALAKKVDVEKEIDPNWEGWDDVRYNYGFDPSLQPVFNTIKGVLESDTMVSVRGGKGRWNKTDKPSSEFVAGGHVFEGWSGNELARLTMLIGKFHETFACIQTYSPAGLYEAARRFGWVKMGSDEKKQGFDFSRYWSTCYTPLTLIPMAKPTNVADYDLNPQFASSAVPVGTMYYDQDEDRIKLYTAGGWKTVAFVGDVADSGGSGDTGTDTEQITDIGYLNNHLVEVETGVVGNTNPNNGDTYQGRIAYFNIDENATYTVTRSALSPRFRIYLYTATDIDTAINSKEQGNLVVQDENHTALQSLSFDSASGYNLAVVMLANVSDATTITVEKQV